MKYTVSDFRASFPSEDACLDFVFSERYGHLPDFKRYHRVRGRKCYVHSGTGAHLYPLAGTIFRNSRTKLSLWFYALYLFTQSKNGVSAKELERQLGVTYKCAWRIGHQLRRAMKDGELRLSGIVEVDETYVGGVRRGIRGRGALGKTPVFGAVERQGRIVARVVPNTKRATLIPLIREHVTPGTPIMSDEYNVYRPLSAVYPHQTVQHGKKEYVRGDVHTNTVEGYWSYVKRSIRGTYVSVSPKHLQAYVDEFSWRYCRRNSPIHPFHLLMGCIGSPDEGGP